MQTSEVEWDVLIIDGRSGSGKTQLASAVQQRCAAAGRPAELLHVEELYPGWDGLGAGSLGLARALREGGFAAYDWIAERFGAWTPLMPRLPLIIEGCGALTAENVVAAREWGARASGEDREPRVHSIWLECATAERKARALARDGDTYAPHWERWAAQEDAHYAAHQPWLIADEVREC
ncbi:hypothetical protein [Leucobacter musarum]|uniref:hypothetical protein n=1 Tax=Leucobacter musarum TaxID=1930747 RepID=UPI0006A75D65|nr:hypothetical protein [Leucobacter musarum]